MADSERWVNDDAEDLCADLASSFWTDLTLADLETSATLGDLFDRLDTHAPAYPGPPGCPTQAAFYRLRTHLAREGGLDAKTIRPATPLAPLLPWCNRPDAWLRIETELRVALPSLTSGPWLRLGSVIALAAFPLGGLLLAAIAWTLYWLVTLPLQRAFPAEVATVGDLAREIALQNHAQMAARVGGAARAHAWRTFATLAARRLGSPVTRATPFQPFA